LLPPATGNALEAYRSVLSLDSVNPSARAGIDRIVEDAAQRVAAAIAAHDAPRATNELKTLTAIAPDDPRIDSLQQQLISLARSTQAKTAVSRSRPSAPAPTPAPSRPAARATPNLDLAKTYLTANKLVEPSDANALTALRKARAAGEDSNAVRSAAADLAARLLNRSATALDAAQLAEARTALGAALGVDREFATDLPDLVGASARLRDAEIAQARAATADERLARVAKLRANGQLIEPVGDNAYEVLKTILAEGAPTAETLLEQQRLSFALLETTRTALAARDIDRADVLATRAEEVQPGLPQTKVLREQIGAARAERDDRNAIVQAASLPRRRQVAAVYPRAALLDKTEGWVDLEFMISTDGVPSDIKIKAAQPARVFEAAAIQALRQWRFEPIVRNGVPLAPRAVLRMEFKLKQ
jgi:TonB family protein